MPLNIGNVAIIDAVMRHNGEQVFVSSADVGNNSTCLNQIAADASHNMTTVGGKFVCLCCKDPMNHVQPALFAWVLHEDLVTFDFLFTQATRIYYGRVLNATFNGSLDGDPWAKLASTLRLWLALFWHAFWYGNHAIGCATQLAWQW